jgi:hypothetical protein
MPSSVISNFHYNKVKAALRVIFTTGAVYEYFNVPENEYLAMSNSFSKGIYFNRHIKNRFSFKKIK